MFRAKEEKRAWNCFDHHRGFDAVGSTPQLGSQPELGLLPERRTGAGLADSDYPAVTGPALVGRARAADLNFRSVGSSQIEHNREQTSLGV